MGASRLLGPRGLRVLGGVALLALAARAGATEALAPDAPGAIRYSAPPRTTLSTTAPEAAGIAPAATAVSTIPFFDDTFTYQARSYPYRMVGRSPKTSTRTTTIDTIIVPIQFKFAGGTRFKPGATAGQLANSPIFQPATFPGTDGTQYGDALQRASFWGAAQSNTAWHVVLGRPHVRRPLTIRVPAAQGHTSTSHYGGAIGLVAESYLSGHVVPTVINRLRLPPTSLVILWSVDIDLMPASGSGVILGEHSAGEDTRGRAIWTWVWASWHGPTTGSPEVQDVAVISHEIAEWYNDPFVGNFVPPWDAPPSYPCTPILEVGDPLTDTAVVVGGYHLQDEALLSWFSRESPSTGFGGRYSLFGTLTAPAPVCTP